MAAQVVMKGEFIQNNLTKKKEKKLTTPPGEFHPRKSFEETQGTQVSLLCKDHEIKIYNLNSFL